eukprot:g5998.t1
MIQILFRTILVTHFFIVGNSFVSPRGKSRSAWLERDLLGSRSGSPAAEFFDAVQALQSGQRRNLLAPVKSLKEFDNFVAEKGKIGNGVSADEQMAFSKISNPTGSGSDSSVPKKGGTELQNILPKFEIVSEDSSGSSGGSGSGASSGGQGNDGGNDGGAVQDSLGSNDVKVRMETTKGSFTITVMPRWSPLGAAQFLSLVESGFYTNVAIFRVLPGFVAQFGIHGDPETQRAYGNSPIQDDPPSRISNKIGTMSFAAHGPNTRNTQVFFNTMDNARLDSMGFSPFAYVDKSDLSIITSFFGGYGESVNQGQIFQQGNAYLKQQFPKLDYLLSATLLK